MTSRRRTLEGRGAVVTGAGRGIGAAIARELAARGARVVLVSRSGSQTQRVTEELLALGQDAFSTTCDVSDPDQVDELQAFAEEQLGSVDILANNAGIASSSPFPQVSLEEWNQTLGTNATGPFLCMRAFIAPMLDRHRGRIINVASVASRMGAPYIAAYTASKHAVLGLTRSVAAEVARKGVTVNCVCPGYVDTDMTVRSVSRVQQQTGLSPEDALSAILKTVGQSRLVTPEEVASAVAWLCEDEASSITGQALGMDAGGFCA